jgi:hypothetical protein
MHEKEDWPTWWWKTQIQLSHEGLKDAVLGLMANADPAPVITPHQQRKLTKLAKSLTKAIGGTAEKVLAGKVINGAVDMIKELKAWAGTLMDHEADTLNQEFLSGKWDPATETLEVFCAEKFNKCLRLQDTHYPEGLRERHMRSAILNNMPDYMHGEVNRLATTPPNTWEALQAELLTWYTKNGEKQKQEEQGKLFLTQRMNTQQGQINALTAAKAKGGGKGKGKGGAADKTCGYCSKKGHIAAECRKKAKDQKKGKGKGEKGGKGDQKPCGYCKKVGHYARDCRTKKKDEADKAKNKTRKTGGK